MSEFRAVISVVGGATQTELNTILGDSLSAVLDAAEAWAAKRNDLRNYHCNSAARVIATGPGNAWEYRAVALSGA